MGKRFYIKEILPYLNASDQVVGSIDQIIDNIADKDNINSNSLDWVHRNNPDPWNYLSNSRANVVIVPNSLLERRDEIPETKTVIFSENPMLLFTRIANAFFVERPKPGIHPSAVIDPEAIIGENVYIGPFCMIGKCEIGEGSIIYDRVTIHDKVRIGKNVEVFSGSVIGTTGLGCLRDDKEDLHVFPHVGGVEIADHVVIGANCSIAKGSLSNTVIGRGAKINALCFIAHNCIIGQSVLIAGSSVLNGSVTVEDYATIYSQVIIRDQMKVGKRSIIGMGSVVTKNVPHDELWLGNPAKLFRKLN